MYLWPDNKKSRTLLTLRLIRVGSMCLITDVTDPRVLSTAAASELYRRRWGLEFEFRSLKQTLMRRKMRSGSPANARKELDWTVIGLWTLALQGGRAVVAAGHGPRPLSLAGVLVAVRAARLRPTADRALKRRLGRVVQDGYRRRGSQRAYSWPHKKKPPPPGLPIVIAATQRQVQAAA